VTVAVMPYNPQQEIELHERDLEISWFSGTGPGGQNRNKVQASCRLKHVPSGVVVCAQTRSRINSLNEAKAELKRRLTNLHNSSIRQEQSTMRKGQVGSGQRGDKIRTIQFQNNVAQDHRTGKRITAEQYMKGNMNLLW
jgi:peptide chain release factor 1